MAIECDEDEDDADGLVQLACANAAAIDVREIQRIDCTALDSDALTALLRRLIAARRPAIFVGCVTNWSALHRWNDEYLTRVLGASRVHVARTPTGEADAIASMPDGERVFARPDEAVLPFDEFARQLASPLRDADGLQRRPVLYASHQNSSFSSEYEPLWADVELSLAWADEAFGRGPAACNFWMGEDAARTSVHADLFDNMYVVVRGAKHFALLPPQEGVHLNRSSLRAATYVPSSGTQAGLELSVDRPEARVYWSTVDLEGANSLEPKRAVVNEGELLFLPALWWHAVSQRAPQGVKERCSGTIAVNMWYEGPTACGEELCETCAR